MGHSSQILYYIIMFLLLSLHSKRTHILVVAAEIEKVSGMDENQEKEALIVEKFRALLGLRRPSRSGDLDHEHVSSSPSPSPSPSPTTIAAAPSPAPALPLHVHPHARPPRSGHNSLQPNHKSQEEETNNGSKTRRVLAAVLGSAGATILVCVLGFVCVCWKFRKHRRKIARTMPSFGKKGRGASASTTASRSRIVTAAQNAAGKVSVNPGLDLVYLNSLEMDLESERMCLKQDSATVTPSLSNHSSHECALGEREEEEQNQEPAKSVCDDDNASSSLSTREILSVHDDYDPNQCVVVVDDDDDDQSFHSFCDSHSSNVRLSNASMGSILSDKSENFPPYVSKISPSSRPNSSNSPRSFAALDLDSAPAANLETRTQQLPSNDKEKLPGIVSSPPPPPPPPLPHFYPLKTTRIVSKASCSPTLPKILSPSNSENDPASPQKLPKQPTQGSSSIPPPPCPPPFLKGNGNSLKGPPPPPSQLPQVTPLGKDGSPLPKLKPLHWDKVRATPDHSMVWDKLRSSSFELDEEMIESLFGYNLKNSMKNDEAKSKSPSPSKHILDQKRLQNITILSKALNATSEQVCYALIQGEGLCLQQLEALAKMVLTKEEETKLCSYKGDINELGSAEKFVKAMLSIPFAFLRIESMLYKETFEDEVVHLRKSFSMLEEACKELRSSRLFLKLLEAVLKTGNRMNVGTIRGGARAFKLDTLLKLADVKGTDGRTTLLHFVVQEIIRSEGIRVSDSIMGKISISQAKKIKTEDEREEEYRKMGLELVSGLSTELYNVKKTATIDLDVLASSVSNLSEGMAKLQQLVQQDLGGGKFVESMKLFLNYADKKLKELREDESRVMVLVRQITEYFHGELSRDDPNPLRIFVIVRDFLGMLDHVCKELRSFKAPTSPKPLAPFR